MVFPCPLRRPADGMTQRAGPHADLEIAQIHSAGSISAIKSELACRLPVSPGSRAKVLQACRKDTTLSVPLGQPVLVGGSTLEPISGEGSPQQQLYLVIEATKQ